MINSLVNSIASGCCNMKFLTVSSHKQPLFLLLLIIDQTINKVPSSKFFSGKIALLEIKCNMMKFCFIY